MRSLTVMALMSLLVAGCTAAIPLKDDFGNSALAPAGDIPPEFAEFNNYDPAVNGLLAEQTCATSYAQIEAKTIPAQPGQMITASGRCRTHQPGIGFGL